MTNHECSAPERFEFVIRNLHLATFCGDLQPGTPSRPRLKLAHRRGLELDAQVQLEDPNRVADAAWAVCIYPAA
jgi:hypothetical protein